MKKNRVFKSLFFVSVICIVGGLSVLHSCRKDVEPIHFYTSEASDFVQIEVINSESKDALSGVSALVTYPDKSDRTIELTDGILTVNMDNRDDGNLTVKFVKDGYVSKQRTITVDRSEMEDVCVWEYYSKVMLTEVNKYVTVTEGAAIDVKVEGSDAMVKFPKGCLTTDTNIQITETPSDDEIAAVSNELEVIEGKNELGEMEAKIALKSFNFLPEGQVFEEPIEISFPIPTTTKDLEFTTLVDGVWEPVPVIKSADGTEGTASISHFSDWILCTTDRWSIERIYFSDPISFAGNCDENLVATIDKSFDSYTTPAKDDLPFRVQIHFQATKNVDKHLGYEKTIDGEHVFIVLKNVTQDYTIEIPSFPVIWWPEDENTCHTGGAGK